MSTPKTSHVQVHETKCVYVRVDLKTCHHFQGSDDEKHSYYMGEADSLAETLNCLFDEMYTPDALSVLKDIGDNASVVEVTERRQCPFCGKDWTVKPGNVNCCCSAEIQAYSSHIPAHTSDIVDDNQEDGPSIVTNVRTAITEGIVESGWGRIHAADIAMLIMNANLPHVKVVY